MTFRRFALVASAAAIWLAWGGVHAAQTVEQQTGLMNEKLSFSEGSGVSGASFGRSFAEPDSQIDFLDAEGPDEWSSAATAEATARVGMTFTDENAAAPAVLGSSALVLILAGLSLIGFMARRRKT